MDAVAIEACHANSTLAWALQEQAAEEKRASALRALIEEERKKILAEAAGKLGLAYMPRGVLSSKEDFEMFRAAADK